MSNKEFLGLMVGIGMFILIGLFLYWFVSTVG